MCVCVWVFVCVTLPSAGKDVDQHEISSTLNERANGQNYLFCGHISEYSKDRWFSHPKDQEYYTYLCPVTYLYMGNVHRNSYFGIVCTHSLNNYDNQ